MQELKELRDQAISLVEDESIDTDIDLWINNAIREAEKLTRWSVLKIDKVYTSDASGEVTLPAFVRAINNIWSGDETTIVQQDVAFARRNSVPSKFETRINEPYYIPRGISTATQTQPTCDVTAGSSSISIHTAAATWFADVDVGKAVTFAGTSHTYEILTVDTVAETATIYPDYRGATESTIGVLATTNPQGEQVYRFYTGEDALYASQPMLFDVQRYHPRVYLDTDRFLLSCEKCIRLLVEQQFLRNGKYDRDAINLLSELEAAIHKEVAPELQEKHKRLPQGTGRLGPMFSRGPRRRQPGFRRV